MSQNYKVKIDKKLLYQFLIEDDFSKVHLKEVKKVILAVLIKYFNKYTYDFKELEAFALLAVLERRKQFNPTLDAYNYIYTICRNEIGNKIVKFTKELTVEDILPLYNASVDPEVFADLPSEINKFKKYLLGAEDFDYIELRQSDAINLVIYILQHTNLRKRKLPSFIKVDEDTVITLYKLLLQL